MAKLPLIQTVLAITNHCNMDLHQVNIKGAYLNSNPMDAEVIFMKLPPGYTPKDLGTRVLCLCWMLYSLKQSGR